MNLVIRTIMNVGRATVFAIGLAVILAVVLGVATTANAKAGDPLKLGKLNTVNQLTQLVGSVAGPSLRVDNNSTESGATALDLQVEPGKRPMTVSTGSGTATNLSADKLDGQDSDTFFSGKTYIISEEREGFGSGITFSKTVFCDEGDKVLGGGSVFSPEDDLIFDAPATVGTSERWAAVIKDNNPASKLLVKAICADFPPLR